MHIPRPFRDPRTSGLVFAERADSRPSYAPFGMVCVCVCLSQGELQLEEKAGSRSAGSDWAAGRGS